MTVRGDRWRKPHRPYAMRKTRTAFVLSLAKKESSAKVRNHLLQFEQCAATWSNAGEAADEKQFVALLKEKVGL